MNTPTDRIRPLPWYRVPVVWLGIVLFAGSLAGCVWMIVVAAQHPDHALPVAPQSVMGVPAHRGAPP